ncbi:MAG: hypothetical protein AAFY66_19510, partial [Pseudomonadota bacterium]
SRPRASTREVTISSGRARWKVPLTRRSASTGRVILARSLLAERRVSGTFHLARPDEIVTSLVDALGLERRDLPARIVLLS